MFDQSVGLALKELNLPEYLTAKNEMRLILKKKKKKKSNVLNFKKNSTLSMMTHHRFIHTIKPWQLNYTVKSLTFPVKNEI